MITLLGTVMLASLVGSFHCVGMCGPLVAFYAGADTSGTRDKPLAHLAYHGGRLATYALLGAVAGALGRVVDFAGTGLGVQRAAAVLVGLLMIAWGVAALAQASGVRLPATAVPRALQKFFLRRSGALKNQPPMLRALAIGLFSAALPCGWLYAFALIAAGTGSVLGGALVMAVFWLGTVPWLLGLGVGVQFMAAPLRKRLPALTAILLIALGLYAVVGRSGIVPAKARMVGERRAHESAFAGSRTRIRAGRKILSLRVKIPS
ncbi:MAG: sulfite exporter TauE/SafE family protein [Deltaproteobacteria bacterium]|nr:sulfite exporter TauE/SafE family protein [Deltaproteobacteria bacterium]